MDDPDDPEDSVSDGGQYKTTEEIEQRIVQNARASGNLLNTPDPQIQDHSVYMRFLFWSFIEDSGFPDRVNHAVAAHRQVDIVCMQDV